MVLFYDLSCPTFTKCMQMRVWQSVCKHVCTKCCRFNFILVCISKTVPVYRKLVSSFTTFHWNGFSRKTRTSRRLTSSSYYDDYSLSISASFLPQVFGKKWTKRNKLWEIFGYEINWYQDLRGKKFAKTWFGKHVCSIEVSPTYLLFKGP